MGGGCEPAPALSSGGGMYNDCTIRIERLQNGFTVRVTDPKIVKQNDERNKGGDSCCAPWQDPEVKYAFTTKEEVIAFITENLDKALPVDEYSSTFDKAVKDKTK
jgi:hypothetical protein